MVKAAILLIAFFSLLACDNDFKEVGGELVDGKNFEALQYNTTYLSARTENMQRVQTNGLSAYSLGVYKDDKYGQVASNILAQFKLSAENPSFGENPILDSVVFEAPYFSTQKEMDDEETIYELDSVFGDKPVKLSVYRSNYALRDYDPNHNYDLQAYYSDEGDKFEQNLIGDPLYVNNSFFPSAREVVVNNMESDSGVTRKSPRIHIRLSTAFFKKLIIDKEGADELQNNDNFQNYFRGLYFKAESIQDKAVLSLLNFNSQETGITLYYRNKVKDSTDTYNRNSFRLTLGNQVVNVFNTEALQKPGQDTNLYLKGGAGMMAVIDLFDDPEQLDSLRQTDWLINEASLKFYINKQQLPQGYKNPERILIYDLKNGMMLRDYITAVDIKENDVLDSRTTQLGRVEEDDNGNLFYKIRLTDYVDDIINKDSTNTRLGVVVSQNVNDDTFKEVELESGLKGKVPSSTVMAPDGTAFYGPQAPGNQSLKLEIFYTRTK